MRFLLILGCSPARRCARGSLAGARYWERPQVFLSSVLELSPSGQSDPLGPLGFLLVLWAQQCLVPGSLPPTIEQDLESTPRARALAVSSAALSPGHCARPFPSCAGPGLGVGPSQWAVNHAYFIST